MSRQQKKPMSSELKAAVEAKQVAQLKLQTAEAEFARTLAERRTDRITSDYDFADFKADKKRRKAKIEYTGEAGILDRTKQLKGINLTRDLLRNFTSARAIDWQKRVNVVGAHGPKVKLHWGEEHEEAAEKAQDWFNDIWSKVCDSRDDQHFSELCACGLGSLGTDGGFLVVFDDFDREDGKLLFYTTDQMVEMKDEDWKKNEQFTPTEDYTQERGLIRDKKGRVVGYIVSNEPGLQVADADECMIVPRELATFAKRPWRLNQWVPVPEYVPMTADMEDLYEMRLSELQTSKKVSKSYAFVKSAIQEQGLMLQQGAGGLEGIIGSEDADGEEEENVAKENYDALEQFSGGYTDYGEDGDEVQIHDPTRPNDHLAPFFDHCLHSAGSSVGVARCYTSLRAENNYSAFRGEMVMSWKTFLMDQKWLERHFCDWAAKKAIGWAVNSGRLDITLPDNWQYRIAWDWPTMPVVDASKEYAGPREGIKAGLLSFRDAVGVNWRRVMDNLAEEIAYAKKRNLPLAIFETVAGAMAGFRDAGDSTGEQQSRIGTFLQWLKGNKKNGDEQ